MPFGLCRLPTIVPVKMLGKHGNIEYGGSMRIVAGRRYSAGIPAGPVGSHHDTLIKLKKATRTNENSDTQPGAFCECYANRSVTVRVGAAYCACHTVSGLRLHVSPCHFSSPLLCALCRVSSVRAFCGVYQLQICYDGTLSP